MEIANFIFNNQNFTFDIALFRENSGYFSNNEPHANENINLISEFDDFPFCYDEFIPTFIQFCHNQQIEITNSNAIPLNYLSRKYLIQPLIEMTEEYINNNYHELIDVFLSSPEEVNQQNIYENLILKYFSQFLNDDRLFHLAIPNLYRILSKYSIEDGQEKGMIDFLMRCLNHYGSEVTPLISLFEFNDESEEYLIEKLMENSEFVDFKLIDRKILKGMHNINKTKEAHFFREINQMKTDFYQLFQEMKTQHEDEIKELTNKIDEQQKCFEEQIGELKKTIFFKQNGSVEMFNKLKGESQALIALGIKENQQIINDNIEKIYLLTSYFSKEQKKANYRFNKISYIEINSKDNKESFQNIESIDNIIVKHKTLKMLHENKSLFGSEFFDLINNLDCICFEIHYPSSKYFEILECLSDIKEKVDYMFKIKIIIKVLSEDDQEFKTNSKYIDLIEIKSNVNEIPSIGESGFFEDFSSVEEIIIPDSVSVIGSRSFYSCSILKKFIIPSSVTTIQGYAFSECSSLKSIKIPSSIKKINEKTFFNCTSLTKIELPSSITSIGESSFGGCTSLSEIKIPSSVKKIKSSAFERCESLSQIEISPSITEINFKTFSNCTSLTNIELPSSITSIGKSSFKECSSLSQITIPSSVESIGSYSFENCSSLSQIKIPNSVKKIYKKAFMNCTSLKNIKLPSYITSIDESTFKGCNSLQQITIPSSVASIGKSSFEGCTSLSEIIIPTSVTKILEKKFKDCTSLTNIELPSSITSIGESLFKGCTSLSEIKIPSSVKIIESSAFERCESLSQIEIPPSITEINFKTFSYCTSLTNIELPSSITSIGKSSFKECSSLSQIIIPSSVGSIGKHCFKRCLALVEITMNPYQTKIGEDAFLDCLSLKQLNIDSSVQRIKRDDQKLFEKMQIIKIPSSVTFIEQSSFEGCTSLSEIIIPTSVTKILEKTFKDCTSLTKIELPSSITSIGESSFEGCTSLLEITMNPYQTKIEEDAFLDCLSLKQLNIDSSVKRIKRDDQKLFEKMQIIKIPSSVTFIEQSSFEGCTSLSEIIIPTSVTKILEKTFKNCTSLTKIELPSSITSIGESSFRGCTSLKQITIPSSVTTIGDYSFKYCTSLSEVTIKSSTWIGFNAFEGCSSLNRLTNPFLLKKNSPTSINFSNFSIYRKCIKYPVYSSVFNKFHIEIVPSELEADFVWLDGFFAFDKYTNFHPSKYFNKMIGIHEACKKLQFFKNIKRMQTKFNQEYESCIPLTFIIPNEKKDFLEIANDLSNTWIFRLDHSINGRAKILSEFSFLINQHLSEGIIQRYISPLQLNGYKFSARLFLLITNLSPLTLFIHEEGFSRFCSEPYQDPTPANIDNKYSHITSFLVNSKNPNPKNNNIYCRFSETLNKIVNKNESDNLWKKIKDLATKSIIAIYNDVLNSVHKACDANDSGFTDQDINVIDPNNRFSHLLAIDIIIDKNMNPLVLDINDNPGMRFINQIDEEIKTKICEDEVILIINALKNGKQEFGGWQQLLPTDDLNLNRIIQSESILRY